MGATEIWRSEIGTICASRIAASDYCCPSSRCLNSNEMGAGLPCTSHDRGPQMSEKPPDGTGSPETSILNGTRSVI